MTEITDVVEITPTYNDIIENGKYYFLEKIEKQEIIDEKTKEKTINFIENQNTGGFFQIHNKNDNNPLGWLCLYQGKIYIMDNDTQIATLLPTNTFEDLENLTNTHDIYYKDKEKPNALQLVSIEDENNIQTDKGVVLSFYKIDLNNPNSNLCLFGIYNGEFKEITKEIINPETNEKTIETKKMLTGNANIFYTNGNMCIQGSLEDDKLNGVGKWYYENEILWQEGTFKDNKLNGVGKWYNENGKLWKEGTFKDYDLNGEGKYYYENGTLWQEGTFEDNKLNGEGKCYYENEKLWQKGTFKDDKLNGAGKWYIKNGTLWKEGTFKDDKLNGEGKCYYENETPYLIGNFENDKLNGYDEAYNMYGEILEKGNFKYNKLDGECICYHPVTIKHGEFINNWLYSGSGYLRKDPNYTTIEERNNEQINPENKIYTLERDIDNPNKKRLIFYTTHPQIGLDRNIVINIDENNIATLQTIDGEPLLLTETEKIQKFFKNMSLKQVQYFDERLSPLFYTPIINQIKYPNITVLLPDVHEYHYKENKDITQTMDILNKIPQDKRNGKYIIPCMWLKSGHQVNLIIDFDKKICEIINTAVDTYAIDKNTMLNLKKALNKEFSDKNWCVYENNTMYQSTGNCYIASNIVATEKTVVGDKVKEYNKKKEKLIKADKKIKKYKKQYEDFKKHLSAKDIGYETLVKKVFNKCQKVLKKENKTEIDDKSKLNFLLNKTGKKLEHLNNAEQQDKNKIKQYERIQEQIKQALDLLYIKELKEQIKEKEDKEISEEEIKKIKNQKLRKKCKKDIEQLKQQKQQLQQQKQQKQQLQQQLQETLNTIINNNNKDTQQTITAKELEKQVQSLSNQYNDKIEQIVINEILYNDLRNKVEELKKEKQGQIITEELLEQELLQKKSIEDRIKEIKKDTKRLKIEKENFVRYNLILKERLFNECDNQFDRELSKTIMNEGNAIIVV